MVQDAMLLCEDVVLFPQEKEKKITNHLKVELKLTIISKALPHNKP